MFTKSYHSADCPPADQINATFKAGSNSEGINANGVTVIFNFLVSIDKLLYLVIMKERAE